MRESSHAFSSRNAVPEYRYTNYDPELVKQDYERISGEIMEMQIALDQYNQTFLFEADILKNFRTGSLKCRWDC